MYSSSALSTAGAASRGAFQISPWESFGQCPSHASPFVNIVNGGTASSGPARVNAGPLLS